MTDFDRAFGIIIDVEGGIVVDAGGLTKYGISQRAFPKVDIANITLADAKDLYLTGYWNAAYCTELPWPLSLFVFDCAVNQGVPATIKLLQKAAGVAQDGMLGNASLAAIGRANKIELAARFMAERALRYTGTRNFDIDGRGWFKRLFVVTMEA